MEIHFWNQYNRVGCVHIQNTQVGLRIWIPKHNHTVEERAQRNSGEDGSLGGGPIDHFDCLFLWSPVAYIRPLQKILVKKLGFYPPSPQMTSFCLPVGLQGLPRRSVPESD